MKVEAVVFDLFNTLVHFTERKGSINLLLKKLQFPRRDKFRAAPMLMSKPAENVLDMARILDPTFTGDLADVQAAMEAELASVVLYDDTLENLQRLKDTGLPIYLLSNLSQPFSAPVTRLGLAPFFDNIFYSWQEGYIKPNRALFDQVQSQIDCPKETILMVGDSYVADFEGARKAGWQALLIDRKLNRRNEHCITSLHELLPEVHKRSNPIRPAR